MRKRKNFKLKQLGVLLLMFVLSGCKKTPTDQAVVNKNDGVLEKAMKETESGDASTEQDYPKEYKESFQTDSKDVTVTVDAKVKAVQGALPVVRVEPREITVDEVKAWTEVLFEGVTPYEPDTVMTKSEIEEAIVMYKKGSTPERLEENSNSDEEAQWFAQLYEQYITELEEAYKTAPEAEEKKPCEWKFYPTSHYDPYFTLAAEKETEEFQSLDRTLELQVYTDELNGYAANIWADNRDEDDFKLHNLNFFYLDEDKMAEEMAYQEFSEEKATDLAEKTRKQLQLKDWKIDQILDESTEAASSYTVYYAPVIEGAAVIPYQEAHIKSEDIYAANYYTAKLEIKIYNGLVQAVWLTSTEKIKEIVTPDVQTIDFEQVCERFKKQMQMQYTRDAIVNPDNLTPQLKDAEVEIRISEIKQGLFRIKEKDNADTFLYVPAWYFEGRFMVNGEDYQMQDMPLVMINGIDGSIINMELGY